MIKKTVHIVGAGLSGLTLAYLLKKKGIEFKIFESSNRIGGRIETIQTSNGGTIEMGATWCHIQHNKLLSLLDELNIGITKQHTSGISLFETSNQYKAQEFFIPEHEEASYRIENGTSNLIQRLTQLVGEENIYLNQKIVKIQINSQRICLITSKGLKYISDYVVTTLPPNLLVNSIDFEPQLPTIVQEIAKKTHTWMGESIKFGLEYYTPFWKKNGYSGILYSHVNLIQEMYDHSSTDGTFYALKGFLNGQAYSYTKEERKVHVLKQLERVFGLEVTNYVHYYEKLWRNEEDLFLSYDTFVMPHQNNGHVLYQNPFFGNKLFVSGSETGQQHPGYMEGAIQAAYHINSFF